jgi:HlyD family secretion protein
MDKKPIVSKNEDNPENEEKEVVVFVYDAAKKIVKKVKVKTGIQDTKYIEVLEGLKPGEEIVVEPYNAISRLLKNDMKVLIVEKEKLFEVKK